MPKTKSTITITDKDFRADTSKWLKASGEGVVEIVDENNIVIMRLCCGYYPHTRRVEHQFEGHRDSPQMLSQLRDYYCKLGKKGHLGTIHALIEFIEAYA